MNQPTHQPTHPRTLLWPAFLIALLAMNVGIVAATVTLALRSGGARIIPHEDAIRRVSPQAPTQPATHSSRP